MAPKKNYIGVARYALARGLRSMQYDGLYSGGFRFELHALLRRTVKGEITPTTSSVRGLQTDRCRQGSEGCAVVAGNLILLGKYLH